MPNVVFLLSSRSVGQRAHPGVHFKRPYFQLDANARYDVHITERWPNNSCFVRGKFCDLVAKDFTCVTNLVNYCVIIIRYFFRVFLCLWSLRTNVTSYSVYSRWNGMHAPLPAVRV